MEAARLIGLGDLSSEHWSVLSRLREAAASRLDELRAGEVAEIAQIAPSQLDALFPPPATLQALRIAGLLNPSTLHRQPRTARNDGSREEAEPDLENESERKPA